VKGETDIMAFNTLEFEQFLNYVDNITNKNENDEIAPDVAILEYVKAHQLSSHQLYVVAILLCKIKNPITLLEFATKYVSDKHFLCMIGNSIFETQNIECIDAFIKGHPGLSINDCIINKMCEYFEVDCLYTYLESEFVSIETKKNIVNTFIGRASLEQLVVLLESYSVFITPEQRDMIKNKVDVLVQMETTNASAAEYARSFFVEEKKPQDDIKPAKQKIPANNQ